MDSTSVVSLACAANGSYILPLAVMLESLKRNLRPGLRPELYLIHAGIPRSGLEAISSIVETHSIALSEAQLAEAPRSSRFPREASAPLLLPGLLPGALEKVLFLDADMLVLRDAGELWETPLDQNVLAAVQDAAVPRCSAPRGVKGWQELGIPPEAQYFNCGMLLIHLERWRERDVTRRARRYLETTRGPVDFLHQEALNAALWNEWKPLHARWNLLASLAGRSYDPAASDAWRQPGIVHFAGRMKPWRAPIGGPFNAPYQQALRRVAPSIPSDPSNLRDWLCSVYDRYFRAALYPIEQYLWRQRLI
jgi:lipopolysaccharide biosynthesis glycosyltransferase